MTAPPRIRRAAPADLAALESLERATFATDRISRRQWRRHVTGTTASVLVIGASGDLDAAAVVFYRRNSRNARLYSLAVRARARGTGLGAALLAAVEADARTRGCTAMYLEVHTGNAVATALYESRHYARIARLPGYYEDGAAAHRYSKALGSP